MKAPHNEYPIRSLVEVTELRKDLGLKDLSSIDASVREESMRRLLEKSESLPSVERSSLETYDIMEQFEGFSSDEIKVMLQGTKLIEFTKGCNGGCPFCFLHEKGEKRGVTGQFSWNSLVAFKEKYGNFLPRDIVPYHKSDPFDYAFEDESGVHSFKDLYDLFEFKSTISTAVPKGSEKYFLEFMTEKFENIRDGIREADLYGSNYGPLMGPYIRLSVGRHNIQRIESTLRQLIQELQDNGYSDEDISLVLDRSLEVETRLDPLTLGPLIERLDPISRPISFSCVDSVVISPGEIKTTLPITPSKFYPSGSMNISLNPGECVDKVPIDIGLHYRYKKFGRFSKYPVLPLPLNREGKLIEMEDSVDTEVMLLGRVSHSLGMFVTSIATYEPSYSGSKPFPNHEKEERFFADAGEDLEYMNSVVKSLLEDVQMRVEGDVRRGDELELYSLLYLINWEEARFLVELHEEGASFDEIICVAQVFCSLDENTVDQLPDIISEAKEKTGTSKSGVDHALVSRVRSIFKRPRHG